METKRAVEICPTSTQAFIESGALLVDVRERNEVEQLAFDVPEILHIPLSEFEDRYQEIPRDRDVAMVCKVGARSLKTTYYLMNMGYENVYNMKLGLVRWVQRGFPTKGDTSAVLENNESSGCCGSAPKESNSSACCESSVTTGSSCC
jgi:rhodanese-related sulfurtransferase